MKRRTRKLDAPPSSMATKIRQLAEKGLSDPEIAARLGVARERVYGLRRYHGIPPGVPPGGSSHATGWEQQLVRLHTSGATNQEIGRAMGWTLRSVQQRLHELGLPANRGGVPRPPATPPHLRADRALRLHLRSLLRLALHTIGEDA